MVQTEELNPLPYLQLNTLKGFITGLCVTVPTDAFVFSQVRVRWVDIRIVIH